MSNKLARFEALLTVLVSLVAWVGCGERKVEMDTPLRAWDAQVIVGGELALDGRYDDIVRPKRIARREVRGPLIGIYEVLKGTDFYRDSTLTAVPLGAGFTRDACKKDDRSRCPGRHELADAIRQAGVEVVGLASGDIEARRKGSLEVTRDLLSEAGICTTGGSGGERPCRRGGGEVRVEVIDLEGEASEVVEAAKQAVGAAGTKAGIVVAFVALSREKSREERRGILRKICDEASFDVLVGHHMGPFDGIELRDGSVLLHNPGPLLAYDGISSAGGCSFVYKLHLHRGSPAWIEGVPIRVLEGRSRGAFNERSHQAVGELVSLSGELGTEVINEFGRAIVELGG
ncbi:MAG: hypothetical protein R6V85_15005 [Polyangia bacterium]